MKGICSLTALVLSGLSLLISVEAKSTTGDRVLVLLDSTSQKASYSQFWQQLEDRQFELVFKAADDQATTLNYFGESLYNHIIHFAPKTSSLAKHPFLNNVQLVNFINKGGNLLVATGTEPSETVRALAVEFDMDLETETVYDHQDYQGQDHSHILSSGWVGPDTIINPGQLKAPVLYSGTGLRVGSLPFSHSILTSSTHGFLSDQYRASSSAAEPVTLVGTLQSRNSARVAFVGSLDLFSDAYMNAPLGTAEGLVSGNQDFITQLTQWTFQEKSVLKVTEHAHHKQNETEQPSWYRVKDDIVYHVDIEEYREDRWVPYEAEDVQLEVIMLDPYIRTTLQSPSKGRFEAQVRLPDVYGVFTLKVNYKRPGLTYLTAEDQVSIRPFRHNEYPRFLTAAYPYYASTGSMILGFLVFSAVWLSSWGTKKKEQ